MIPSVRGNDVTKKGREESAVGKGGQCEGEHFPCCKARENKSGEDLEPDPKSEANLYYLAEMFVCLVTSRGGRAVIFRTGKFSFLSAL